MAISMMMLRCFAAVAQSGNLADAGMRLGRTQSALSMTLKQFEDQLGAQLFEGERKNRLTMLGEEIFELAQHQLRSYDDTISAIEGVASAPKGYLSIASIPSVASLILPQALEIMTGRHSALSVEVRDADTSIVIDTLMRGQADIGIVSGQPSLSGVRREVLFEDAFGLVCAPDHPLALRKDPVEFDDLLSPAFIRNNLCNLIEAPGMKVPLAAAKVTVHNTLSLIGMVRTGAWITVHSCQNPLSAFHRNIWCLGI